MGIQSLNLNATELVQESVWPKYSRVAGKSADSPGQWHLPVKMTTERHWSQAKVEGGFFVPQGFFVPREDCAKGATGVATVATPTDCPAPQQRREAGGGGRAAPGPPGTPPRGVVQKPPLLKE